jgi:hypothetical protein
MHRLFIALILLTLTANSYAAEVKNLYQASAPVSSRDLQEREQKAPELLRQVMLKLVGNEAVLNAAPTQSVLDEASNLVQKYEYQRTNIVSADLTRPDQLSLKLSFERGAVNKAIHSLNLPMWGRVRPDILIWTAIDNGGQQSLLGLESDLQGVFKPLTAAADRRGLPVLMPLMDLQDQQALRFDDVWQGQQSAINTASERYEADVVLTLKLQINGQQVKASWVASGDSINNSWQTQGSLDEALTQGIGQLADSLSQQYTQVVATGGATQWLNMQVSNVLSYADFNRLMQYLQELDLISDVRVNNLSEQQLDLDVSFHGSLDVLQRTLAVGRLLSEEGPATDSKVRHYRLVP